MGTRFRRSLPALAILLIFCSLPAAAQSEKSAAVWIMVKSAQGGPVAPASVAVIPEGTPGAPQDHTADDSGLLPLDLRPGGYYLVVTAKGFVPEYRHLQIRLGDTQNVEITIRAGAGDGQAPTPAAYPSFGIAIPITFPQHTHAVSPSTRYDLSQIDRELGDESRHAIYLQDRDKPDDDPRRLFLYDGRIDLSWNSTSDLVAITDYAAGDATRCRVFDPFDRKLNQIPVLDRVMETFPAADQKILAGMLRDHHLQLLSCAWSGPRQLRLELIGYEDGKPVAYTRYYFWNVP